MARDPTTADGHFVTVFHFVCTKCRHPNEHRQAHPLHVRPHLMSIKCARCGALNWLGGLKGTPQQVVTDSPSAAGPALDTAMPPRS